MENWKKITDQYEGQPGEQTESVAEVIPVIEEQLHLHTKIVETGKVNISKRVRIENYLADLPLLKEEVIVEKKPINEYIEGEAPGMRLDGDITIIPVIREVIVKRLLLVEEIHITKRRTEQIVPVNEVLRKEEVTVRRTPTTSEDQT